MRILILSKYFAPSIGGLETIAAVCFREFSTSGHEVRLITQSQSFLSAQENGIFRNPSHREIIAHLRWSDVVFHNDASGRYLPTLLYSQKPYVVLMSSYIHPAAQGFYEPLTLKRRLLIFCFEQLLKHASRNIAASPAIAAGNRVPAKIIPDPFSPEDFGVSGMVRDRTFLFAGRLVSTKGVEDLFQALFLLRRRNQTPSVTIAGPGISSDGTAETTYGATLLALANQLGVRSQLVFEGPCSKEKLKRLMNQHSVFIIPSRWHEAFGIIALEAIACGCMVIGTNGGGLSGAIGPCGVTYPNGDAQALAESMSAVLRGQLSPETFTSFADSHLLQFHPERVCGQLLRELEECLAENGHR